MGFSKKLGSHKYKIQARFARLVKLKKNKKAMSVNRCIKGLTLHTKFSNKSTKNEWQKIILFIQILHGLCTRRETDG